MRDPADRSSEADSGAASRVGVGGGPRESGSSGRPLIDSFPGYEILRELSRGGQGVVYQALQLSTKRKVAIKLLHGGRYLGESERARFEREIYILAQMRHPNIVRIFDSGRTAAGGVFYVMDYIPGKTLDVWIKEHPQPPLESTLRMFVKLCRAVREVHVRAVIHRNIKPSNVKITPDGEPMLLDFGYARPVLGDLLDEREGPEFSPSHLSMLSVPWSSPEQTEGSVFEVDARTDIYAMGLVLYQMLTGQFPYQVTGELPQVLRAIVSTPPQRPGAIRSDIDPDLDAIILHCLNKRREERYQSAGRLAEDLEQYLNDEPISVRPPSLRLQLRAFSRRNRRFVTMFAVVVVAVLAALVSVGWAYVYAHRAMGIAEKEEAKAKQALASEKRGAGFLKDILASANPYTQSEERLQSVDQLLVSAGRRVDAVYADDAVRRAEFSLLLATALFQMDQYEPAEELYKKAIAAAKQIKPVPDERLLIEAIAGLGWMYGNQSRYTTAAPYLKEASERAISKLNVTDELYRRVCVYNARNLDVGEPANAAIAFLDSCVKKSVALRGPDDADVLDLTIDLGALHSRGAELTDGDHITISREILDRAYDRLRATVGFDDPRTQRAAIEIVKWSALHRPGLEAEQLANRVAEARRIAFGPGNLETLRAAGVLVEILAARGNYADAYEGARNVVRGRAEAIGGGRRETIRAKQLQLRIGIELGVGDAELTALAAMADECSSFCVRTFGETDADTYESQAMQARINIERGEVHKGCEALRSVLARSSNPANATSFARDITPMVMAWHADGLLKLQQRDEAYTELKDAHALALKRFGRASPCRRALLDRLIVVAGLQSSPDLTGLLKDRQELPPR